VNDLLRPADGPRPRTIRKLLIQAPLPIQHWQGGNTETEQLSRAILLLPLVLRLTLHSIGNDGAHERHELRLGTGDTSCRSLQAAASVKVGTHRACRRVRLAGWEVFRMRGVRHGQHVARAAQRGSARPWCTSAGAGSPRSEW
jgi:hypothetical protein